MWEEYDCKLNEALKCGWIHTQIVPDNHAMDLPDGCRDAVIIETWGKQEYIDEELDRVQRLFTFSKTKKCFKEDKLCDVSFLRLGEITMQVCKLNSTPFSTRAPDDKQFHYFPVYVGEKPNRHPDADIKITIMHHRYEWCERDGIYLCFEILSHAATQLRNPLGDLTFTLYGYLHYHT